MLENDNFSWQKKLIACFLNQRSHYRFPVFIFICAFCSLNTSTHFDLLYHSTTFSWTFAAFSYLFASLVSLTMPSKNPVCPFGTWCISWD